MLLLVESMTQLHCMGWTDVWGEKAFGSLTGVAASCDQVELHVDLISHLMHV